MQIETQSRQTVVCRDGRRRNVSRKFTAAQLAESFWAKVTKTDGCWLWDGALSGNGYGSAWDGDKVQGAHVRAWILTNGPVPEGLQVLHECDNGQCVRPDHLFLGTQKHNMEDMVNKGRRQVSSGERCSRAKLSVADVIAIRADRERGVSCLKLASKYGVKHQTILMAASGESWKQLTKRG